MISVSFEKPRSEEWTPRVLEVEENCIVILEIVQIIGLTGHKAISLGTGLVPKVWNSG